MIDDRTTSIDESYAKIQRVQNGYIVRNEDEYGDERSYVFKTWTEVSAHIKYVLKADISLTPVSAI